MSWSGVSQVVPGTAALSAATSPVAASSAAASSAEGLSGGKIREAAREVEGVFLREMLKALERTTKASQGSSLAGQDAYGGMVVEAVADSVTRSGGLGIQELMVRSLDEALGRKSGP